MNNEDTNWYCFEQNNSGGSFVVNDKVCHRLFIEARTSDEAVSTAEELGCYWDGVERGLDCPCCGDRWPRYFSCDPVNLEKYRTEGYRVSVFDGIYKDTKDEWEKRYRKYGVIEEPKFDSGYSTKSYVGTIRLKNIEEYAQYLANEYGWTSPDARIYYADGRIKEIFSVKRGENDEA